MLIGQWSERKRRSEIARIGEFWILIMTSPARIKVSHTNFISAIKCFWLQQQRVYWSCRQATPFNWSRNSRNRHHFWGLSAAAAAAAAEDAAQLQLLGAARTHEGGAKTFRRLLHQQWQLLLTMSRPIGPTSLLYTLHAIPAVNALKRVWSKSAAIKDVKS